MEDFKKGQKVKVSLFGAGTVTYEIGKVLKINKSGVWLDNGDGFPEKFPFVNGRKEGVLGFYSTIEPA
jgi:hypothetical protein